MLRYSVRRRQRRGGPLSGGIPLPPSRNHNSEASDDEGSCFWRCPLVTKTNNNNNKKFRRGTGRHRDQTIMMLKMLIMLLILVSIFIIMTGLATPQPTTMKLGHAVVGTTTTPIYWINLDKSKDRMEWMSNMFSSLGLTNTHRVAAHAINSTWRSWIYGTLVFHPLIKLVPRTAESNHWRDHTHLKYYYEEAACTLSHLEAIKQAYEDGNEHALILEDDAQLSTEFFDSLPSFLQSAPSGWKVLQFACNNPDVVAHGSNLLDPFISWQPYHWSTGAYVVNRAGMKSLLDKLYSKSFFLRHDTWRIEQHPFVVADEVIYATIGDAYTSTKLRVGARKMKSTVQDLATDSGAMTTIDGSLSISVDLLSPSILDESLLVLMNVRIWAAEYIETELRRIQQDSNSVCKLYKRCKWGVNVVLTTDALRESFDEALASDKFQQASKDGACAEFHFEVSVSEQRFNKYVLVSQFVMEMANFDLVLLKDADMWLTGFPWRTFIARKGNAVVSAPLRQSFGSSSVLQSYIEDTQHFLYHEAILWLGGLGTKWSRELFANIQPVKVPILEQSFALFDGRFASHFFGLVLTEEYVHQRSDYWLDYLWCQVAFGWDEARPGCRLVPVAIVHHNTRQLSENASASSSSIREEGFAIRHSFSDHPTFGRLMELSVAWSKLVGNQNLRMIEERCRSHFMDSSNDNDDQEEDDDGDGDGGTPQPFNLEACSELFINRVEMLSG